MILVNLLYLSQAEYFKFAKFSVARSLRNCLQVDCLLLVTFLGLLVNDTVKEKKKYVKLIILNS